MTTETVTDYETTEVEREYVVCDISGHRVPDGEDHCVIGAVCGEKRHACADCLTEMFGVEGYLTVCNGFKTIEVEVEQPREPTVAEQLSSLLPSNHNITLGSVVGVALGVFIFPFLMLAVTVGDKFSDDDAVSLWAGALGTLLWVGLPLAFYMGVFP